jgi:hypothetical protein
MLYIPCIIGNYIKTQNQQNAQICSLDIYNITLNIPTRFGLQGVIIRESNQVMPHKTKLATLVHRR